MSQPNERDRCQLTVVVFDPNNSDRVTVLNASAAIFYDRVRQCYLVHRGDRRIRVIPIHGQSFRFRLRLTINNFADIFGWLPIELKEMKRYV